MNLFSFQTMIVLNSRNGSVIWQLNTGRNVYIANFIEDQNNDSIADILASQSSIKSKLNNEPQTTYYVKLINLPAGNDGHLVLFSGKNGNELAKLDTPNGAKTFYMPEILVKNGTSFVIFGTGTPYSPGNLSVALLGDIIAGKLVSMLIDYKKYKKNSSLSSNSN